MDNRGIDSDPGWVNRKLRDLERAIEALRSERRAAATTISDGDLTVSGGGSVIVKDGGNITTSGGGNIEMDGGSLNFKDYGSFVTFFQDGEPFTSLQGFKLSFGALNLLGDIYRAEYRTSSIQLYLNEVAAGFSWSSLGEGPQITGPSLIVPLVSTGASANTFLSASGKIHIVVSSRRYKQDIEDCPIDPTAVLGMQGKTWRDKSAVEADPDTTERQVGFIAEDLHNLGLTQFVRYNEAGEPDAIQYDRLSVALLAVAKDQQARLEALEVAVAALTKEP